jgi:hypothetical protein
MPKPIVLLAGAIGALILIVVVASVLGGGKSSNSHDLVIVVERAQEIQRVSTNVQQQSQDPNTQYLAATVLTVLGSQQAQLTTYLSSHKVKISAAQLALYQSKTTDTQLNNAAQNNALGSAYASYLKNAMQVYEGTLSTAAKGASKTSFPILKDADTSVKVILAAPELASIQQ